MAVLWYVGCGCRYEMCGTGVSGMVPCTCYAMCGTHVWCYAFATRSVVLKKGMGGVGDGRDARAERVCGGGREREGVPGASERGKGAEGEGQARERVQAQSTGGEGSRRERGGGRRGCERGGREGERAEG
eukprot:1523954-Rhodomonas_salina.2